MALQTMNYRKKKKRKKMYCVERLKNVCTFHKAEMIP